MEHFATLLKQGDVPSEDGHVEANSPLENVVRPAAFNKASANAPDAREASEEPQSTSSRTSHVATTPARAGRSEGEGGQQVRSNAIRPDPSEASLSDLSLVLEKIEAAGASMRLVEERANRQSTWTQDFLAVAKTRLRDAELRVQDAESRCALLVTRSETAERELDMAEQRCRTTEKRLDAAESRLEAAERRLEAALELAHNAEARCAEATARAVDADRWMHDILTTVQKEFPTGQIL